MLSITPRLLLVGLRDSNPASPVMSRTLSPSELEAQIWSTERELNPQPATYKAAALPIELSVHGWHGRARTYDLSGNSRLLYQLSYMPKMVGPGRIELP